MTGVARTPRWTRPSTVQSYQSIRIETIELESSLTCRSDDRPIEILPLDVGAALSARLRLDSGEPRLQPPLE